MSSPSQAFLQNNPGYFRAGQSPRGADRYDAQGYRYSDGRKKIMGYSRNQQGATRGSGLDEFYARQRGAPSRADGPAFQGQTAEDIAEDMNAHGERSGFGGEGKMPNRNLSPREQSQMGLGPAQVRQSVRRGPNAQQRGWAQATVKPQIGAGQTVQEMGKFTQNLPFMGGVGRGMEGYGKQLSSVEPTGAGGSPNFSRSSLINGAKASGDFDRVRKEYNTNAAGTGMRMNGNGSIKAMDKTASGPDGTSEYARDKFGAGAEDIRARRDFATGRTVTTSGTPGLTRTVADGPNADEMAPTGRPVQAANFRREISSKYGSGSNVTRQAGEAAGGEMVNPASGRPTNMSSYLADQDAVTKTKEGTSGFGASRTFDKAGEDFLDPAKLRQSLRSSGGGGRRK
jgi:hypothetical protein